MRRVTGVFHFGEAAAEMDFDIEPRKVDRVVGNTSRFVNDRLSEEKQSESNESICSSNFYFWSVGSRSRVKLLNCFLL